MLIISLLYSKLLQVFLVAILCLCFGGLGMVLLGDFMRLIEMASGWAILQNTVDHMLCGEGPPKQTFVAKCPKDRHAFKISHRPTYGKPILRMLLLPLQMPPVLSGYSFQNAVYTLSERFSACFSAAGFQTIELNPPHFHLWRWASNEPR